MKRNLLFDFDHQVAKSENVNVFGERIKPKQIIKCKVDTCLKKNETVYTNEVKIDKILLNHLSANRVE